MPYIPPSLSEYKKTLDAVEKKMSEPSLRTIEEHNKEREEWWASNKPYKGERVFVKCPKCPGQLLRKNPMPILTTHPPLQVVHCSKCDFSTRIYL